MPTSHDFDGAITRVAPAGAVVAGSVYKDGTDNVVYMALTSAASGVTFQAKVIGLVKAIRKTSGTAWTAGQRLANDGTAFTHVISGVVQVANAYVAALSADIAGDVILCLPTPVSP